MIRTTYKIAKMDCSSEEQLIRMRLESIKGIKQLKFDLQERVLDVFHTEAPEPITAAIASLNLNDDLIETVPVNDMEFVDDDRQQRTLLWQVLIINFGFFVLEIVTGIIADSMGLIADSMDMLADSIVYILALFVVGAAIAKKKRIARLSGYFQLILAVFGLAEVIRRFVGFGEIPEFRAMIIVSLFALVGNAVSLYLLQKSRSEDSHMKASMIFTSNDVVINIGVIVAGALVYFTQSKFPDLVIGVCVFIIVGKGAFRIMKLG